MSDEDFSFLRLLFQTCGSRGYCSGRENFRDQGVNEVCPPRSNCFENRKSPGKANLSSPPSLGCLAFALNVFLATAVARAQIALSCNDNSTNEDVFGIERAID